MSRLSDADQQRRQREQEQQRAVEAQKQAKDKLQANLNSHHREIVGILRSLGGFWKDRASNGERYDYSIGSGDPSITFIKYYRNHHGNIGKTESSILKISPEEFTTVEALEETLAKRWGSGNIPDFYNYD